jgi:hypothetical protein
LRIDKLLPSHQDRQADDDPPLPFGHDSGCDSFPTILGQHCLSGSQSGRKNRIAAMYISPFQGTFCQCGPTPKPVPLRVIPLWQRVRQASELFTQIV